MEIKQRQTAFKVRVSDLLNGKYVVQDGWEPNYILVNDKKVSRANILGVIVSKQSSELGQNEIIVLDDGSGRISVRSFEGSSFSKIKIGDVVLLIGRPREYGNEIYVVQEIIKVLDDKRWVDVRKRELGKTQIETGKSKEKTGIEGSVAKGENLADTPKTQGTENQTGIEQQESETGEMSQAEKIIGCIKRFDNGSGADFEDVIKEYGGDNAEEIVNDLLRRGDVFELKPGKLKILE